MKYCILILSALFSFGNVTGCTMNSSFGEIRYEIDSADAHIIHVTLITTDSWYCLNDSAYLGVSDGATFYHYPIPLIDTANVENGYILKTYKGDLQIDSLGSDSTFTIYYAAYSTQHVANSVGEYPLQLNCSINYSGISKAGIASPIFNGARIGDGVVNDTLTYDPLLYHEVGDSISVSILTVPGGDGFPYQTYFAQYPNDTMYVNDSSGLITWIYARGEGEYYDILYQAKQYRNGNYIGYIQRNMLLYVLPDTVGAEGITDISRPNQQYLRCYPNPSNGTFMVSFTDFDKGNKTVTLYNYMGQIVYTTNTNQTNVEINANALTTGVYIVQVRSGSVQDVAKIVISKQ